MPTYVYECSGCDKTFEVEQRITEPALTDCECGCKGTLKRVIQPVAVAFKGSGSHINDYAAAKAEGKSETEIGKQESSDSKPVAESKASETESKPAGDKSEDTASTPPPKVTE